VKQQREELARELVRKDSQMKEMQQRLESGDGCKYLSKSISSSKRGKRMMKYSQTLQKIFSPTMATLSCK
jgi:hypothetical protein